MSIFEEAFRIVVGEEGAFSDAADDPGNWTGGVCGKGICRGTKYGIAAGAHPTLNIASLTLQQARALYQENYWAALHGDELPPPLALLVFDAAVNCGAEKAVRWLQTTLDCHSDGEMGPATIEAVRALGTEYASVCAHFQALRLHWMTTLSTWSVFGLGWARRICGLPYSSLTLGKSK